MRYRNASPETRTWPGLVNADTGTTVHLAPGESAEIDGNVTDGRLVPERKPTKNKADTEELTHG